MLAIETSSTKRCGATTTMPATSKRAACSSADRPAVAVAEQPGALDLKRLEQGRQHLVRLHVHEVRRPTLVGRFGRRLPVAVAREHQPLVAVVRAEALGKILPHRDRAEAFVEEHDRRPRRGEITDPAVLDPQRLPAPRERGELPGHRASRWPQAEALDLAGRRLRELVDELDHARVLVRREAFLQRTPSTHLRPRRRRALHTT